MGTPCHAVQEYQLVHGLPASLMEQRNKTIAVFELMQRYAGLNRERRRELIGEVKSNPQLVARWSIDAPRADQGLMALFLDGHLQMAYFWRVLEYLQDGRRPEGSKPYSLSVDVQLLRAYEPEWEQLCFDEAKLLAHCSAWPVIHAGIKKFLAGLNSKLQKDPPCDVFMLWPRLQEELHAAETLDDAGRRLRAGAAFALSSAAGTEWFIREALRLCPALSGEFEHLLMLAEPCGKPIQALEVDAPTLQAVHNTGVPQENELTDLVQRLDELTRELHLQPSRDAVAELVVLAADFQRFAHTLPARAMRAVESFEEALQSLLAHCHALCAEPEFSWLAQALAQVEARWRVAARGPADGAVLKALADDAHAATQRCDEAALALREAQSRLRVCKEEADAAVQALASARGLAERRPLLHRKDDAARRLLDAEAAVPGLEDELLSVVSPFAEPFDLTVDYAAQLDAPLVDEAPMPQRADVADAVYVADAAPQVEAALPGDAPCTADEQPGGTIAVPVSPGGTTAAQALPLEVQGRSPTPEAASDADARDAGADADTAQKDGFPGSPQPDAYVGTDQARGAVSVQCAAHASPLDGAAAPANDKGSEPVQDDAEEPLNEEVGTLCRPIWQLLQQHKPALACHVALWTKELHPQLITPPPNLLAAAALAAHLLQPDGSVQAALAARLQELPLDAFAQNGRPAWWTAMNLLLVAATLRPMILAPGSGAATVAGYLHLGPRHQALYELVQELRDLSPRLSAVRIEPAVLRQARSEAAMREDMQALQRNAADWFRVQAPAVTIKFAAATNVWKCWLRPTGIVWQLVQPVIHNRQDDLPRVREIVAWLADPVEVMRLVRETDRKELQRRKGDDIHAGALEQLLRRLEEASSLARAWLSQVEQQGSSGNRMREVVVEVRERIAARWPEIERELNAAPVADHWGLVAAGQAMVMRALRGVLALFNPGDALPPEPLAADVLLAEVLEVPALHIGDSGTVEEPVDVALQAVRQWLEAPQDARSAFQTRLEQGDLLGAEMLGRYGSLGAAETWLPAWRQEREAKRQQLRREIQEARRVVEIGSAYGYLADADRGGIESRLSSWEAQIDDIRRFDLALGELSRARKTVSHSRQARADEVRAGLAGLPTGDHASGIAEVEQALDEGDIATANEMVHRLSKGQTPWLESDDRDADAFNAFFPAAAQSLESWLSSQRRELVEHAMRNGAVIPAVDTRRMAGAQRAQAAGMLSAWFDMKSRKVGDESRLHTLFTGLTLTVKELRRQEQVAGRELWTLEASAVEDRHVCPVPLFGSVAHGRYRVVCVWERPIEDDLLQWVGDTSVQRPILLLYFGRMTERKWRELSRLAKVKRKSFLLLDETLLAFLCGATGSRLQAWFSAALPFTYSSPYDATAGLVPPEMFYGRGMELEAVLGLNGRCFIYGGRQLGKTALLKRAGQSFHAPARGHFARWIDLRAEGIGVSRGPEDLWVTLAEQLKQMEIVDAKAASVSAARKQSVENLLRAIRSFLESNRDRRILLLLDEADRFFELDGRDDFAQTRRLKQLMDETGRRFKVVFAGLHNVLRMTERANHPLAHFGEPIEIGPLREGEEVREAEDLIRRPMAAAGFDFESRSLVIRILAQTNYYPSLIQLYCSHLLRHMLERVGGSRPPHGPRYQVTDRDIELVYSSGALREEIRAKFRLTLQLDPRYEVVAHAIARELLNNRFAHADGVDWRTIQHWAKDWWAPGFHDTSELDFRVLLDEMVGLGVLSRPATGRYTLRNPNVLLLLGTQEEVESVLIKDREPAVEFESASFRPPLREAVVRAQANVFTFQQLSELLRRDNRVTVVTGTRCAGIDQVARNLADYLNLPSLPVVLDNCCDRKSFVSALERALEKRGDDAVTPIVVPDTVPWSGQWLQDAYQKLSNLRSGSRFASVVFVADPGMLWGILSDASVPADIPWMSLQHWRDEYLRHWLEEERQLQIDPEDRRRLGEVSGYWPGLLMQTVGNCAEVRSLRERVEAAQHRWGDAQAARQAMGDLGLTVEEPVRVLRDLVKLEEPDKPLDAGELALVAEYPRAHVDTCLRWAELLGLSYHEGAGFWRADPVAAALLQRDVA